MKKRIAEKFKREKSKAIKELFEKKTEGLSDKEKLFVISQWLKILEERNELYLGTFLLEEEEKIKKYLPPEKNIITKFLNWIKQKIKKGS